MAENNTKQVTVREGRHFFIHPDIWISLLVLGISTLLFNLFPLDIIIQKLFYTGSRHWSHGSWPLFQALYRYASFPALFVAVGGLFLYIRSFRNTSGKRWRLIGLFLILAMAIGPGLVVNSLLKDRWGRPRPRDITQFGGKHAYEAPLRHDASSPGKSFPSGHASMGFYFYVLYFLFRGRKPRLAKAAFVFATFYGLLIGLARVAQGGHFPSDVIWAGGLVYLCCAIVFHLLGLRKDIWRSDSTVDPKQHLPLIYQLALYALGILIAGLVFLGTPFYRQHEYSWTALTPADFPHKVFFDAQHLDLRIAASNESYLRTDTSGFGFPGSKIAFAKDINSTSHSSEVAIRQHKEGIFTELNCLANLSLDSLRTSGIQASVQKGDISLSMAEMGSISSFSLEVGKGDVTLRLPPQFSDTLRVDGLPTIVSSRRDVRTVYSRLLANKPWQVKIGKGRLIIR